MNVKQAIRQLDIEIKANLLTGSGFWTTPACPEIGLDSVKLADGPHGMRVQSQKPSHLGLGSSLPATCFPTASAMACSWNTELCEELGKRLGEEAAYQGVSMVLGPSLNLKRSPLCGRNFEYFSEDPYLSGKLAAAYVRGIQANGVTSCIKHFAMNSRELGRMVCDSIADAQTVRETYLTGFEIAVKEGGAGAVMSAYNKINGTYCNENERLLNGILRGEWQFKGLVVSDWGGGRNSVAAVKAGADLEMPVCKMSAPEIISAVRSGELDEKAVDESVARLYSFVERAKRISRRPFDVKEHAAFARRCAEESVVLLKNADGALPLNNSEKVALIGEFAVRPRYQGAGSSLVNPTSLDNILGEIKKADLNFIGFARGFKRFGNSGKRLEEKAVSLARRADTVILCLGLDEDNETEGADRADWKLPPDQTALLTRLFSLGKKIIVVLSCGSVVDTGWDAMANGLIHAHLSGQSGAGALVNVLTGKINPSGRLAESYPLSLDDVPCSALYSADPYRSVYAEGIFVGYKYYGAENIRVKYPFGYGLSYTAFSYGGFFADERGVGFTVKNTGGADGATVAQIYVKAPRAELAVSPSELKAFRKIFLKAGEEKQVFIPFDDYSFRIWNAAESRWETGGEYTVSLGENSRDTLFTQTVNISADTGVRTESPAYASAEKIQPLNFKQYYNRNASAGGTAQTNSGEKKGEKRVRKHIVADQSTIVSDLSYCKGVVGKLFGAIARHYNSSNDKLLANSMNYLPLRTLMQFMNLDAVQAEGFIQACNGEFFKGMKKIIFKK